MKKVSNKFLIDAKFYPISDEDKSLWNTNLTLQEITKEIYEEELTDEIKSDFQTTLIGLRLVELSGNYETMDSDQLNYDQSKAYWFVYGSLVTFHNYSENVFIQMRKKIQDWFKYQHYYPISIAYQPSTTVNFAKKGVFQGSGGAVQTSTPEAIPGPFQETAFEPQPDLIIQSSGEIGYVAKNDLWIQTNQLKPVMTLQNISSDYVITGDYNQWKVNDVILMLLIDPRIPNPTRLYNSFGSRI